MKILKFWYVPCVLFCLYCLYTLVTDSYEVLYVKSNPTDPVQYLACTKLSWIYPNKKPIDLKDLRGDLYNHLKSSINNGWRRTHQKEFEELLLKLTKSDGYLILNGKVCFIANDEKELGNILIFLSFKGVYFAIQRDTFDFVRIKFLAPLDQIEQLIVQKKERPYSDCSKSNSRFHCLNECFKRRFRLSRYFYNSNETGIIRLKFSDKNQTIKESEKNCFGECKRENCKLVQFISIGFGRNPKTETFECQTRLSEFNYWIQFIGLFFSFIGLFFSQFESTANKFTKSRVRRRKVKIGLFYLNLAIIFLSLAYCGYLCIQVALNHKAEANDLLEREKTRNLIQPKTVHLAICVDINEYVDYDFEEKTMSEIERATDGALDDALEGIYVNYGGIIPNRLS